MASPPSSEDANPDLRKGPPRARQSSSPGIHSRESSISALSKLYQQHQKAGTLPVKSSAKTRRPQATASATGPGTQATGPGTASATVSSTATVAKKIGKKVSSISSMSDYFSKSADSSGNSSPLGGTGAAPAGSKITPPSVPVKPSPSRLPRFQPIDPNSNSSSIGAQKSAAPFAPNLHSSTIYSRRRDQNPGNASGGDSNHLAEPLGESSPADGQCSSDGGSVLGDRIGIGQDENDEILKENYSRKMKNMSGGGATDGGKAGTCLITGPGQKTVNFYTNNDSESDVDMHSDDGPTGEREDDDTVEKDRSSSTESADESRDRLPDVPGSGFMGFVRRMTMTEGHGDLSDRVRTAFEQKSLARRRTSFLQGKGRSADGTSSSDSEEDGKGSRGFFSKIAKIGGNVSGGGLMPGASGISHSDEGKKKLPDEENQIGTEIGAAGDRECIPLRRMKTEHFEAEARDLLNAHAGRKGLGRVRTFGTRRETGQDDAPERSQSEASETDGFLAPNPDLYLRDEGDIFELEGMSDLPSYVAPPERVRGGVLSSLLSLYQNPYENSRSRITLVNSEASSVVTTPTAEDHGDGTDYFDNADPHYNNGQSITERLKESIIGKKKAVQIDNENLSAQKSRINEYNLHRKNKSTSDFSPTQSSPDFKKRPMSTASTSNLPSFNQNRPKKPAPGLLKKQREQAQARITVHIAGILQVQRFILRMCKALMLYGAPTHRLEEYLTMTARVLEVDAQFIYLPGCMIVSFGDATTRTSEVQLVRVAQGLDLYKLHVVHRIYKKVIHDLIGVEDASTELDDLLAEKSTYPPWLCVFFYAFASAMVTPFAFGGGWINIPVSFAIGSSVGFLKFYVAPKSNLYLNVFEVTASIVVSFIGRALGSISSANICFSAVTQGSLSLILPGYIILCGSLELQSRNLVAGSVRMFYAIIYSLFLGFGITLGAAMYGWIDSDATSETTCADSVDPWWFFLFVPLFSLTLGLINQARWFQLPIMLVIACAGYVVNYFASKHFYDSTEFTSALGAFIIGILGNLYSRVWKGLAVSAMLPAIFVQVPSGIASKGSLLAGVESANKIVSNSTTTVTESATSGSGLSFGVTMVQVAIGISVGLFASTIAVYPFGKKATSVFTL